MSTILRPAILKDADYVGPRLRTIDALESCISLGTDGAEAVRLCIQHSTIALAAVDGDPKKPYAVLGVAPCGPRSGSIWLLGTDEFDEHHKDMMRLTEGFLSECQKIYPTLVIHLLETNRKSLRFLKRFGFKPFPVMDLPDSPLIHLVRTAPCVLQ